MRRVSVARKEIAEATETAVTFRAIDGGCCSDCSTSSVGGKWL